MKEKSKQEKNAIELVRKQLEKVKELDAQQKAAASPVTG